MVPSDEYYARKKAYIKKYQRAHYTSVNLKFRNVEDKEIIDALNKIPNKSAYVRELIKKSLLGK